MNEIIHGDSLEILKTLPDESVDCVVTSPPYNVGIDYGENFDDEKEWGVYFSLMRGILKEIFRTTRDGGRVCWNIPSFSSRQNLYFEFNKLFREVGFMQYAEIIWDKHQISSRTAWGSFASASQPNILPRHEYILVFYKGNKNYGKGEDDINKDNFIKWTDGMWSFAPETNSTHPAPYPIELPSRCIQMFSFVGDKILDPFAGSCTTLIAAKQLGRECICIEKEEQYVKIGKERLASMTIPLF